MKAPGARAGPGGHLAGAISAGAGSEIGGTPGALRPQTVDGWLAALGGEYARPELPRDERLCMALARLHTGLARERYAWGVLLGGHGLGRTVRDVKRALAGDVRWATPVPRAE